MTRTMTDKEYDLHMAGLSATGAGPRVLPRDPLRVDDWSVFRDLVGVPHERLDCWALARECLARMGVEIPADPALALAAEESLGFELPAEAQLRRGDVLVMARPDGRVHVGVCLSPYLFLHAEQPTSVVCRVALFERARVITRRVRPRALR